MRLHLPRSFREFDPVDIRHDNIGEEHVDMLSRQETQGFARARCLKDAEAFGLHQRRQRRSDFILVVDKDNR